MPGHGAVRNAFQIIPAGHIRHRNIHKIHGPAAAVTDGEIRAEYVRTVHLQEEIEESGSHIKGSFPGIAVSPGKGEQRAEAVNNHFMGILCDNPEMDFSVRKDFSILLSVPVRFSGVRIK